jgi:hypothetical protein
MWRWMTLRVCTTLCGRHLVSRVYRVYELIIRCITIVAVAEVGQLLAMRGPEPRRIMLIVVQPYAYTAAAKG